MMNELIAEFIGTFLLILLGNGVVANVVLRETKGHSGGWIVITAGWGMAVFVAVYVAGPSSGAHINPAVTLGLALADLFAWQKVLPFIAMQFLGAMSGAATVYFFYRDHFRVTPDGPTKRACFCTTPNIRNFRNNVFSEIVGTFVLVFAVFYLSGPTLELADGSNAKVGLGAIGALPVGLLVVAIGLSLGGTTGYAINPARDLGPRLVYALLPLRKETPPDWPYAWIPVLGPLAGAGLAALAYMFLKMT
jgi:glycerol uptake facilitator protein